MTKAELLFWEMAKQLLRLMRLGISSVLNSHLDLLVLSLNLMECSNRPFLYTVPQIFEWQAAVATCLCRAMGQISVV
jgi:hypothetical protein